MPRTNEAEVRDLYSAHADGTAQDTDAVAFWIEAANEMVTNELDGESVADTTLQKIEALIACHGIASGDPTEKSFSEGDVKAEFEGSSVEGEGLAETRFGRRAIMLDPTGKLAQRGKPNAQFRSYGAY